MTPEPMRVVPIDSVRTRDARPDHPFDELAALAEGLLAAARAADADQVLRHAATAGCAILRIRRCAVYTRDRHSDLYNGRVGHPREEMEARVRRLRMGGWNDGVTRDLRSSRDVLVVPDVAADPRTAHSAAVRAFGTRSMVAIPLLVGDDLQGMLLFDNGTDFYPCLPEQVRLAQIIGRTASHALAQAEQSAAGVGQLRAAVARTRTLGRVTLAEQRFLEIAAGGGGIGDLLGAAASILRRPVAFHDKSLRRLAVAEAPEQGSGPLQQFEHGAMTVEDLVAQFRDTPPGGHATVGPVLDLGVHHRHLVAPVDHGGIRAGWVLTVEHPSRLSSFDELILTRLAAHLALVLATQQRMREANSDARSQLALQLLLGADDVAAVRRNAECLGVPVDAPRVVAHVRAADGPLAVDVDRFVHNAGRNLAGDVLASLGRDGLALLVEVSGEVPAVTAVRSVKGALAAACAAQRDEAHLMAGVSTVCAGHEDLPRGYREAQEVQRCVVGLRRPSVQVLTADDLGPIRLFLGNSNPEAVERFVNDILGRVVADGRSSRTLLTTLQEFFDADCSVRLTAARLGVHENTVRKRLGKISTLTGLDVASRATDQMTVHSALTVLRLRGDLPGGPAPDV